ncbi:MAG TPA: sensor histidine kinase [Thermoanaerobaculia bacterium]|nr:sensor histidine kinase [Thermoanaerobaculia bacterium]
MKSNEARALETYLGTELYRRSTELTRAWLDRLRPRLEVHPNRIFPSEALLNHIPEILKRMSEYLLSGGGPLAESSVREELTKLARLRREQGYDIDEILDEFEILGSILYGALREEAADFGQDIAPEYAIEVAERLYRALMAVTYVTATTFREEGFKDRRDRAHLLGSFGRTLAHEMRNSLGAGEAAMDILTAEGMSDAVRERAMITLQNTLRRLEGLSEDVLALAIAQGSEESAQGRRLSLRKLVEEAVLGLETLALERQVRIEVQEPIPEVQVDATRTELVLINLLGNAIKYCQPGRPSWVRIAASREDGGYWRIEVRDNGRGIPKEMQSRVFDEFVRAHPEVSEGTGLGLAIAREAVEQMGGRIWLASEPEIGTAVCFTVVDPPQARE